MPAAAAAAGLPPYGPLFTLAPMYGEPGYAFGYGLATGASGIGGSPCWNCSTSLRSGPAATTPSSPTGGANACGMGSGIVCWKAAGGCAGEGMPRAAADAPAAAAGTGVVARAMTTTRSYRDGPAGAASAWATRSMAM